MNSISVDDVYTAARQIILGNKVQYSDHVLDGSLSAGERI
jgi:hypothetical protein